MLLHDQGKAIETYARHLAGYLGVPDFVYEPVNVRKGRATREAGDEFLVAGEAGLILQVKSRRRAEAERDDIESAERWCRKHAAIAKRQGVGTRKPLSRDDLRAVSLRGYERTLHAGGNWPVVVIIDHVLEPPITFPSEPNVIYLTLRDWFGLHAMIQSTHGLIAYVRRALTSGIDVPLGQESTRYEQLAETDSSLANASSTSVPVLPGRPLTTDEQFAANLFSDLVDKVADSSSLGWDATGYLRIVERLDRVPTLIRVRLGNRMIDRFEAMVRDRDARGFLSVDKDTGARLCVLYDYDESQRADPSDRRFDNPLFAYTSLRHMQAIEAGGDAVAGTLGVGILHHPEDGRRYSFVLIDDGSIELPGYVRSGLEERFGIFDGRRTVSM